MDGFDDIEPSELARLELKIHQLIPPAYCVTHSPLLLSVAFALQQVALVQWHLTLGAPLRFSSTSHPDPSGHLYSC